MTVIAIDHTAIAVEDLTEAVVRFERLLGAKCSERVLVNDQKVEAAFLTLGDSALELISPTGSDSSVARFLTRRGEGLHHIGVLVDDIQSELERLSRDGFELIDASPRIGVHGVVAFVHPRGTGGVLLELVQRA